MEKYSVKQKTSGQKTSTEGITCPECGAKATVEANGVRRCARCGTRPWESVDDN